MKAELAQYFGPQERTLTIAKTPVVVRTLSDDADVTAFSAPGDQLWKLIVRCTFGEDGQPVFSDDDIPVLKSAPRITTLPLIQAVQDVNGFDAYAEVKNSEAVPSDG